MTPEEGAKAVAAYLPAIPERIRADVEAIVARAICRAIKPAISHICRTPDQLG